MFTKPNIDYCKVFLQGKHCVQLFP